MDGIMTGIEIEIRFNPYDYDQRTSAYRLCSKLRSIGMNYDAKLNDSDIVWKLNLNNTYVLHNCGPFVTATLSDTAGSLPEEVAERIMKIAEAIELRLKTIKMTGDTEVTKLSTKLNIRYSFYENDIGQRECARALMRATRSVGMEDDVTEAVVYECNNEKFKYVQVIMTKDEYMDLKTIADTLRGIAEHIEKQFPIRSRNDA